MKNKTTKFIFKTLILFPVLLVLWALYVYWFLHDGIDNFNWVFSTIMGFGIAFGFAFGIIFWNLFDYEKYDGMDMTDFLESKHKLNIENNDENWNRITELTGKSLIKLKVLKKSDSILKIEIPRKFFDSILTAEKTENRITLKIERGGILKFLPDNAKNYGIIQKIRKEIQTTANF